MKNTSDVYHALEVIKIHLETRKETELANEVSEIIDFFDKYFDFDWKGVLNNEI